MAWFLAIHYLAEAGVETWVGQQARGRQPGSCSPAGTPGGGTGWDSLGGAPASTEGAGQGLLTLKSLWLDGTYSLPTTGAAQLWVGKTRLPLLRCPLSADSL